MVNLVWMDGRHRYCSGHIFLFSWGRISRISFLNWARVGMLRAAPAGPTAMLLQELLYKHLQDLQAPAVTRVVSRPSGA